MTACQYRKIHPLDGSWHPLSDGNGVTGDRCLLTCMVAVVYENSMMVAVLCFTTTRFLFLAMDGLIDE